MTYDQLLPTFKQQAEVIIQKAKEDLAAIRTGRATPALVENILVDAYGVKMRLMELSSITTDGPVTIVVQPFDVSLTPAMEKAISESPLGISPSNQNGRLFVKVPPLSSEQRQKLIKLVSQTIEEKRNAVRLIREEIKRSIKHLFEEKSISEDQKFRVEKDLDTTTKEYDTKLLELKEKKEEELNTV